MFRQILVATDLTAKSAYALGRADAIARDDGAHLHILHVVHDPSRDPGIVQAWRVDRERLRAEACGRGRRALIAATRSLGRDVRHTTVEARAGAPADEILDYAKRHAIDLIVVGTQQHGRRAATVLGSVADAVVRDARCPVLIVRAAAPRRRAAAA